MVRSIVGSTGQLLSVWLAERDTTRGDSDGAPAGWLLSRCLRSGVADGKKMMFIERPCGRASGVQTLASC